MYVFNGVARVLYSLHILLRVSIPTATKPDHFNHFSCVSSPLLSQNYMVGCSDVITGASQRCSDHCRNSLIALTSTEEGEALMKVRPVKHDYYVPSIYYFFPSIVYVF